MLSQKTAITPNSDRNNLDFITEDPARAGSNWYAYVGNNPLRYTDPTGLIEEEGTGLGTPYYDPNTNTRRDFPLQTDPKVERAAKNLNIPELSNPGRWACNFMSHMYQLFNKSVGELNIDGMMSIAKEAFETESKYFGGQVLGENFRVGDAYSLQDLGLKQLKINEKVFDSSVTKETDFTIIKATTKLRNGELGSHYKAGNNAGLQTYDPDIHIKSKNEAEPYSFDYVEKK